MNELIYCLFINCRGVFHFTNSYPKSFYIHLELNPSGMDPEFSQFYSIILWYTLMDNAMNVIAHNTNSVNAHSETTAKQNRMYKVSNVLYFIHTPRMLWRSWPENGFDPFIDFPFLNIQLFNLQFIVSHNRPLLWQIFDNKQQCFSRSIFFPFVLFTRPFPGQQTYGRSSRQSHSLHIAHYLWWGYKNFIR